MSGQSNVVQFKRAHEARLVRLRLHWHQMLVKLGEARMAKANLSRASLPGVNLAGMNLESPDLQGVMLERADLEGANLGCCALYGANLRNANLKTPISGTLGSKVPTSRARTWRGRVWTGRISKTSAMVYGSKYRERLTRPISPRPSCSGWRNTRPCRGDCTFQGAGRWGSSVGCVSMEVQSSVQRRGHLCGPCLFRNTKYAPKTDRMKRKTG